MFISLRVTISAVALAALWTLTVQGAQSTPGPAPSSPAPLPPIPSAAPSSPLSAEALASKARALNDSVALTDDSEFKGKLRERIRTEAQQLVMSDSRIAQADKKKAIDAFGDVLDVRVIAEKRRQLFDATFSEQELRYIIAFITSSFYQKFSQEQKAERDLIERELARMVEENYQKVTHLPYQKPIPPPAPQPPGWFTQLIWKLFPSTSCSPNR